MILQLTIEVPESLVKECIVASLQKRFGDKIPIDQISPISKISDSDVENILRGSCFGELVSQSENVVMERVL